MSEEEQREQTPQADEAEDVERRADDDIEQMRAEMEEALREKEQFRAMAQRAQADLENYKLRAVDEQNEARRSAKTQVILKILTVVDDLDRAMALVPDDAVAPGWVEGLQLVQRNLESTLDSEGVTKIEAEGQPFAPWEHEAVLYEEAPGADEGMVVRVIRDGYKLGDRIVRAAQVAVSKAPDPEDKTETTEEA